MPKWGLPVPIPILPHGSVHFLEAIHLYINIHTWYHWNAIAHCYAQHRKLDWYILEHSPDFTPSSESTLVQRLLADPDNNQDGIPPFIRASTKCSSPTRIGGPFLCLMAKPRLNLVSARTAKEVLTNQLYSNTTSRRGKAVEYLPWPRNPRQHPASTLHESWQAQKRCRSDHTSISVYCASCPDSVAFIIVVSSAQHCSTVVWGKLPWWHSTVLYLRQAQIPCQGIRPMGPQRATCSLSRRRPQSRHDLNASIITMPLQHRWRSVSDARMTRKQYGAFPLGPMSVCKFQ